MKNLHLILILVFGIFWLESNSQEAATPTLSVSPNKGRADCVILDWKSAPGNVLGHVIERRVADGPWLIIGQTEAAECHYTDVLDKSQKIRYRVRSFGDSYYSPYSNEMVCVYPAGDRTRP